MNFLAKALETVQHVVEENQQKQQNYSNNNNQQQQQYGQQSQQQQQQQAANGIFHPQRAHQASFNPNAKYRALFIGINYFGTKSELRGCLNDVKNVSNWLHAAYPMFSQQTLVLTDDQTNNPAYLPTRANILNALNWLVADARPGDCFFLHYSGHGGQARDTSGDEKDGMDSTICPMDYSTAGQITDDELHSILFGRMPRGSKLTALFDSCHSGSVLDLPFTYSIDAEDNISMNGKKIMAAKLAFSAVKDYMAGNTTQALREGFSAFQTLMSTRDGGGGGGGGSQGSLNGGGGGCNQSTVSSQAVQSKITQATAIQFSGCKDDQTSADASIGGTATGAASWALISALNAAASQGRSLTYADVLRDTRANLANKYSQIPQMSSGFEMDIKQQFSIVDA